MSPSQDRGRGFPRAGRQGKNPGGAPAAAPPRPAGEVPRRPDARGPVTAPVQVLASPASPLFLPQVQGLRRDQRGSGAAIHLPFELFPHGCKGSAVGGGRKQRSELSRAAGLPESRAPPPPRLAAESTAEEPALAGGRAGRRAGRGGGAAGRRGGAVLGSAPT